ncbi:MAG TPA: bifunctional adenosylcobinamide kinase/adenosylcobinamide-phosphate guanylyltransferase [Alphaproteobacteria bacterium]|jgi:adenosylcobinamide kinase/adenosylcobinamide-phosphate guanylyltransferase|nr:bifunctional adenosylcobinamide kinase/adenosylcobinamide-phosphate guanylyltransferase [Alphaproteobacteria bacterium]HAM47645.1 bifunctional adenosylcobinamide kinase/adenosylcobinamide-phosphate guanylyltransferase [Alphaproteobacteria bacterium]HBF96983.1 bifunctional adenosylcobinamide kinase/adenosylcobinamide-phosphate guanylyltransferase [Alphaproteobacteria bacterium]HCO90434.1 bifunctional adenosylcobinamide kinase/adenosylcobinamide-phosphate guanylyltransferase [Alphaproteobacteri
MAGNDTSFGPLPRLTFVLGGARSGKSSFAQTLAEQAAETAGHKLFYIATAEIRDAEMADRVAAHQRARGPEWHAREAPRDLGAALRAVDAPGHVLLVDCLTLWLSNVMEAESGSGLAARFEALLADLAALSGRAILVSNEVGLGIVPDNALARAFRDQAGRLNQQVAAQADQVFFVAAGLPLKMK